MKMRTAYRTQKDPDRKNPGRDPAIMGKKYYVSLSSLSV